MSCRAEVPDSVTHRNQLQGWYDRRMVAGSEAELKAEPTCLHALSPRAATLHPEPDRLHRCGIERFARWSCRSFILPVPGGIHSRTKEVHLQSVPKCNRPSARSPALSDHCPPLKKRKILLDPIEMRNESLIPGMLDEITLSQIFSKLPWRAVRTLGLVCSSWKRAITERKVYAARVQSGSKQTLAAMVHRAQPEVLRGRLTLANESDSDDECDPEADVSTISLYSVEERCRFCLPPIPDCETGVPTGCAFIYLDGNIYVLGGSDQKRKVVSDVYVLDLAAYGRQWKRLSSMAKERRSFGCAVMHGKIFAFGGFSDDNELLAASEVYDPHQDRWDPIKAIPTSGSSHKVIIVEGELLLHKGYVYASDSDGLLDGEGGEQPRLVQESTGALAYSPTKNDWTTVADFSVVHPSGAVRYRGVELVMNGKSRIVDWDGRYIYESTPNTNVSHSSPSPTSISWERCISGMDIHLLETIPLDDKLVSIVWMHGMSVDEEKQIFMISEQIDGVTKWRENLCVFTADRYDASFACAIQL